MPQPQALPESAPWNREVTHVVTYLEWRPSSEYALLAPPEIHSAIGRTGTNDVTYPDGPTIVRPGQARLPKARPGGREEPWMDVVE